VSFSTGGALGAFALIQSIFAKSFTSGTKANQANFQIPVTSHFPPKGPPGPWRPPQWIRPAMTVITVPGQSIPAVNEVVSQGTLLPGSPAFEGTPPRVFVFDAIYRADHARELRHTEHPVQTGANISDHAYPLPAKITLEIGMSDVMDSYTPGTWTGNVSKSVAAYQTMVQLQQAVTFLNVTTRLDSYTNMLIEHIAASDNNKTQHGARFTVTLGEINLATVTQVSSGLVPFSDLSAALVPARPHTTTRNSAGTLHTSPVPASITARNKLNASVTPQEAAAFGYTASKLAPLPKPYIPGAGNWSSNLVDQPVFGGIP
jgi:hypothetical protein